MLLPFALLRCQVSRSLRSGSDDESVMNGCARLWWSRAPILTDQKNDSTPGEMCMAHTLIVFNIASFLYTKRKFKVSSLVSLKTSIINIKVVVHDGTSQNQVRIYSCVWYDHSGVCLQLPMNSKPLSCFHIPRGTTEDLLQTLRATGHCFTSQLNRKSVNGSAAEISRRAPRNRCCVRVCRRKLRYFRQKYDKFTWTSQGHL